MIQLLTDIDIGLQKLSWVQNGAYPYQQYTTDILDFYEFFVYLGRD